MKEDKVMVNFRATRKVVEKGKHDAKKEDRSLTAHIVHLLKKHKSSSKE